MFATLLGGLPRPPGAADAEQVIEIIVRAQEEAGLEPITDGRLGEASVDVVERWRFAAGLTDRAVKQALVGPYSQGRGSGGGTEGRSTEGAKAAGAEGRRERERRTFDAAEAVREQARQLAAAGCPLVEIEETEAHLIGADDGERRLFREAHRRLTDGVAGTHLSLSIVGGSAWGAGLDTILDAPYASLAVDLIAGPDNWNLVTRAPSDRGIVAGAQGNRETGDEAKELLLWAAQHASGGRGMDRVGLGSAGSYASLTWDAAVRKMRLLGSAARLAALPPGEELMRSLEPKAISARRAALGPDAPPRPRRRR